MADPNFLNIDALLRKNNQLKGYDVVSVTRQLVNGNNYNIRYRSQSGAFADFKVYVSFKGEIEVKDKMEALPLISPPAPGLSFSGSSGS